MKDQKPKTLDLKNLDEIRNILNFFRVSEDLTEKQELWFNKLSIQIEKKLIEIKQRIKSAVKFYLRYKDKPELLLEELPEYEKEFNKITDIFASRLDHHKPYNEWLFRLAFKGVLKDEIKSKEL